MNDEKYIECGKIINTHGVRGDVKIEHMCDSSEVFIGLRRVFLPTVTGEYKELKLTKAVKFKQYVLAHFENTDTYDAANALRNSVLYAGREDIPLNDGAVFIADLIGLKAVDYDDNSIIYGVVKDFIEGTANGIYLVETGSGREVMIPAVREFVKKIDIAGEKSIYLSPIGGMFDEV